MLSFQFGGSISTPIAEKINLPEMILKSALAIFALALALIPTWLTDGDRSFSRKEKARNWLITILSLFTAAAVITDGYDDEKEKSVAEKRAISAEKSLGKAQEDLKGLRDGQQSQSQMMLKMNAGLGDKEAFEQLSKMSQQLIGMIAESKSQDFLENVNKAYAETAEARSQLKLERERMAAKMGLEWSGIHSYIYRSFDAKMADLEKAGYSLQRVGEVAESLISDSPDSHHSRRITLPNGVSLWLYEVPMVLRGGEVMSPYQLQILEIGSKGNLSEGHASLTIDQRGLSISPLDQRLKEFEVSPETKLTTEEYMQRIEGLITRILTGVVVQLKDETQPKSTEK